MLRNPGEPLDPRSTMPHSSPAVTHLVNHPPQAPPHPRPQTRDLAIPSELKERALTLDRGLRPPDLKLGPRSTVPHSLTRRHPPGQPPSASLSTPAPPSTGSRNPFRTEGASVHAGSRLEPVRPEARSAVHRASQPHPPSPTWSTTHRKPLHTLASKHRISRSLQN